MFYTILDKLDAFFNHRKLRWVHDLALPVLMVLLRDHLWAVIALAAVTLAFNFFVRTRFVVEAIDQISVIKTQREALRLAHGALIESEDFLKAEEAPSEERRTNVLICVVLAKAASRLTLEDPHKAEEFLAELREKSMASATPDAAPPSEDVKNND